VDSHGRVVEVRDYDPWGLELPGRSRVEGVKTREGFTEYEFDDETGLNYGGARYYDPAIGRFTTIDRFASKEPSLSPYQYAGNSPLTYIDVNGDSIVVAVRRIDGQPFNLNHAMIIHYPQNCSSSCEPSVIAEAYNSSKDPLRPGVLIKADLHDPDNRPTNLKTSNIVAQVTVDLGGRSDEEVRDEIIATVERYNNSTKYPVGGVLCSEANCANSNAFVRSVLAESGLSINPLRLVVEKSFGIIPKPALVPGWSRDALNPSNNQWRHIRDRGNGSY